MCSLVTCIFLYACDSWTLTAELQRTQAMETNEEVCAKIQQAIRPHEDLLTIVKRHKLHLYGHVLIHQVCPKPSCKGQLKGEEDKADRRRGGKTTSGNGQVWSSPSPRGQWRTEKNGGNWLCSHLLVPQRSWQLRDW